MRIFTRYILVVISCFWLSSTLHAQDQNQKYLDSSIVALKNIETDTVKVKAYHDIALEYSAKDIIQAEKFAELGYQLAKKIKWKRGEFDLMKLKGNILNTKGFSTEAIGIYEKLLQTLEPEKDALKIAKVRNDIAVAQESLSDYVNASSNYFKVLKIVEELKDTFTIAITTSNIGSIFFKQNDFQKALEYDFQSLKLFEKLGDKNHIARLKTNIGNVYYGQGDIKNAEKYYQEAINAYRSMDNYLGIATLYSKIAVLYQPDYDKIIEYQLKSQAIWDSLNPKDYYSVVNLSNLSVSYLLKKRSFEEQGLTLSNAMKKSLLDSSEYFLLKAKVINDERRNIENETTILNILSELYEDKGDYQKALLYLKAFTNLNDSLYSQSVKNQIAGLEKERAVELKDKEILVKELKLRQLWIYGFVAVALLLMVIGILIYRSRIRNLKMKNEIQTKDFLRQQEALQLEQQVSESELKVIRTQMNPHFIFNVLNSIESYILDKEPRAASKLIQKFAVLSRLILENSTQSLVIAEKDWKALQLYVELESIRFDHAFSYSFQVVPPLNLSEILLPPMLVQPLVENAIHHGLRMSSEKGSLLIRIEVISHEVIIMVEDNGVGLHSPKDERPLSYKEKSFGISGIENRLALLNQMNARQSSLVLEEIKEESGGTRAILRLPVQFLGDNRQE